jgi:multidrug efflux system outer membrane protein
MFGNVSPEVGKIFSNGKTYSADATLLGPIFAAGRIKKNYEAAKARYEQAKVEYERAVTNSFSDVSRALVDREKLVETERQRQRTVTAYKEAARLANVRYASGLSAYFEVLDAQQQLFPAELALAQVQRNRLIAIVNVYKALGGGWPDADVPLPEPASASSPAP